MHIGLTEHEAEILSMHKAGMSDREIIEVLAMRGDAAAIEFKRSQKDSRKLYSALTRLCDE